MALWLLDSAKIRCHLLRLHDNLAEQQHARTDNLTNHAHHAHNSMYLFQIAAWRVQFLPYIRDCVNADNVDSPVCQIEEIVHHLIKDSWIFIIQIPLIGIKGGHDIVVYVRQPCEVARCSCRENLRNCPFILLGNCCIIIEEIAAHVLTVSLTCLFRPLMFLGCMVHNKVHADVDALLMAGGSQTVQVLH